MGSAASLQKYQAEPLQDQKRQQHVRLSKLYKNHTIKNQIVIDESSRENSSQLSQNTNPSLIQQNRLMFKRSGNMQIQTPSRDSDNQLPGTSIRQSRFSKTQVFSTEASKQQIKSNYIKKKSARESVIVDNTPTSTRLKSDRRGSLNDKNIFESLGSKQQSFNKLSSIHDMDSNKQSQKKIRVNQADGDKLTSFQEFDEEFFKQKQSTLIISSQSDTYTQQSIPKQRQANEQDDDNSENGSELYDSQSLNRSLIKNNPESPENIIRRTNQRVKTMHSQLYKHIPLESLQEKDELEELKPINSRNLIQVSPLQKKMFQNKMMSITHFNIPPLSPEQSPIQMLDDVVDGFDQKDIYFSLQLIKPTQSEIAELEQLTKLQETIQLRQQQSENLNNLERKNFHTQEDNLNRSLDCFGDERRTDKKRTTFFRSLVQHLFYTFQIIFCKYFIFIKLQMIKSFLINGCERIKIIFFFQFTQNIIKFFKIDTYTLLKYNSQAKELSEKHQSFIRANIMQKQLK